MFFAGAPSLFFVVCADLVPYGVRVVVGLVDRNLLHGAQRQNNAPRTGYGVAPSGLAFLWPRSGVFFSLSRTHRTCNAPTSDAPTRSFGLRAGAVTASCVMLTIVLRGAV